MSPLNRSQLSDLLNDPVGRELEIGFALLEVTRNAKLEGRRTPLRTLIGNHADLDYSTVMRWVRAAEVLDGPDDPRSEWGVSRLAELARIRSRERRAELIASQDISAISVRALRSLVSEHTRPRPSPARDGEPYENAVLRRAINSAIEHSPRLCRQLKIDIEPPPLNPRHRRQRVTLRDQQLTQATGWSMAVAGEVITEVLAAKARWQRPRRAEPPPWSAASLDEVASLPAGQLEVRWAEGDLVEVLRAKQVIIRIPVTRRGRTSELIQPQGNRKTAGVFGVLDTITCGCLRAATGLPGTDRPCFQTDDGHRTSGCYAQYAPHTFRAPHRDGHLGSPFDIAWNGLANNLLRINLPADGNRTLPEDGPKHWRVDTESADGSLSIALGLFQAWAEANPGHRFTTICSHATRPSDTMLAWLAGLRNVWIGHTLSASFLEEEMAVRLAAIERFRAWGIPSVIWLTTHQSWDNEAALALARRAISDIKLVIEAPCRYGAEGEDFPLLHASSVRACSNMRYDRRDRRYQVKVDERPDGTQRAHLTPDVVGNQPPTRVWAKCRGCDVKCGVDALGNARHLQ